MYKDTMQEDTLWQIRLFEKQSLRLRRAPPHAKSKQTENPVCHNGVRQNPVHERV